MTPVFLRYGIRPIVGSVRQACRLKPVLLRIAAKVRGWFAFQIENKSNSRYVPAACAAAIGPEMSAVGQVGHGPVEVGSIKALLLVNPILSWLPPAFTPLCCMAELIHWFSPALKYHRLTGRILVLGL